MSRILDPKEKDNDIFLRPSSLDEYIGQKNVINNLKVYIGASKHRNETLDHILFYGPPGLGKTTLSYIIANEMNAKITLISGPSLEKPGDLAGILTELQTNDVLFIDEIHRIPKIVAEVLYSAMEDFKFSIILNRDNSSKSLTIDLPPFTLIGATTRPGDLSSPLRARFGILEKLSFYNVQDLAKIVQRSAKVFKFKIDEESALEIAKRSRGTPRIANRILKRVRDFANYNGNDFSDIKDTAKALSFIGIDSEGLDNIDINYLKTLIFRFNGGPVGVETLSSAIGEDVLNLEEIYEPYLIQKGLINKTLKGRVATERAYKHLNINK